MNYLKNLWGAILGQNQSQKGGRPTNSGTDEAKIKEYLEHNPGASVSKIASDLHISRTTVYKWTKWKK